MSDGYQLKYTASDGSVYSSYSSNSYESSYSHSHSQLPPGMDVLWSIAGVVGIAILIALMCKCCCGNNSRGQVIAPPAVNTSTSAPAPYPQQQYTAAAFPAVTTYTMSATAGGTPGYPTQTPYPTGTPYPTATPYPTGGAPYPTGGPYPTAGAPYPTGSPYPTGAPYPTSGAPYPAAPSAPDVAALPPSYDQVMGGHLSKQPSYNPQVHDH